MPSFSGQTIYNSILFLLLLIGFLLLLRYIRSEEGFAVAARPELYDLQKVFGPYPIPEICPIYQDVLQKLIIAEKNGPDGKPVPNDIAEMNAKKRMDDYIFTGTLPCPFSFPASSDLEEVHKYVINMDDRILSKAFNTLLYCRASLEFGLQSSQDAIKKIPKGLPTEGFITECSAVELQNQNIIPLQCVPPASMKASEQADILAEDKIAQIRKVNQKKDITQKLKQILDNFNGFKKTFRGNLSGFSAETGGKLTETERSAELVKKLLENEPDNATNQKMLQDLLAYAEVLKTKKGMLDLMLKYYNDSFRKLIDDSKATQAKIQETTRKLESGDFSSL